MKLHNIRRFLISLLCIVSLLCFAVSVSTYAATANAVTATTNSTIKQGNSAYCYVNIDSLESLASIDVTVHFDPAKVKITNVYNSVSCMLYDTVTNTDSIQFSYILDGEGSSSNTRLFYFSYQVLSGAEVGDAYFDITIGEAYDNQLNEMNISGSRCKFAIEKTVTSKSCSISSSSSLSTSVEQEFTLNYRFSTYQIASGTAVITYDSEIFEVVNVSQGTFLNDKIVDINTDLTGEIYISFVATQYNTKYDFVSVTFKTIKNTANTSKIVLKTPELLDKELNAISCSGYTTNATVVYDETYVGDAPTISLNGSFSYTEKQITLEVLLETDSKLGAGDFVINFDPELVSYKSCTKGFSPGFFNIDERKTNDGQLIFHIVSLSDIVTEEKILTITFDVNHPYNCKTADFSIEGTDLTDSLTNKILLNFVDTSVYLEYQVTFCDWDNTVLQSSLYYYGDTVQTPFAPTKESDMYGTYTFAGWGKEVTSCTSDITYKATYDLEYTDYTVTFKDDNGSIISTNTYHYGDKVNIPENPTKAADKTYTYTFDGWDKDVINCIGDATYTATYSSKYIDYVIIFKNWDDVILSTKTYHWGDKIITPANPTKDTDDMFTYSFIGWDKEVIDCAGDTIYMATYAKTAHSYDSGIIDTPASCKETGIKIFTCSNCSHTKTETIEKLTTHTYDNACDTECNVCKQVRTVGDHVYDNACDANCNVCDDVREITHDYKWVIDKTENCGVNGTKHEECTVCHTTRNEDTVIPATGNHTYDNDCDAECNTCGEVDATRGHSFTNYVNNGIATCTKNATEIAFCDYGCGESDVKDIPGTALEHNYEWVIDNDNNCGKAGVKHEECSLCHDKRNENTAIAATGKHTYSNNCDTKCNVCYKTRTITHTYKMITTKKATTSKNGSIVKACSVCGKQASKTTIYYAKKVKLSTTEYTYSSGKTRKPSVKVYDYKGNKISSKYYTVSYASGRKKVGKYKVTIKLKGNYSGTLTAYFTINPKATKVSKLTAAKKSLKVKFSKVSSQVTGYEIQYSISKKFTKSTTKTKKVTSYKTTTVTLKSLKAKKTYYVRVRTYKIVNGKKYYSGWSSYKSKKTK